MSALIALLLAASSPQKACKAGVLEQCKKMALEVEDGKALFSEESVAVPQLKKACEAGDGQACRLAGVVLQRGVTGKRDLVGAAPLIERACTLGDVEGCTELALQLMRAKDATAYATLVSACEKGSQRACEVQALALRDGAGVKVDLAAASAQLEKLCSAGRGRSCAYLTTVVTEPEKVMGYAKKACDLGDGAGCQKLGVELAKSDRASEAFAPLEKGCKLEDSGACYNLAVLWDQGKKPDAKKADSLYARACELGSANACSNRAHNHADKKDDKVAAVDAKRGCELGSNDACNIWGALLGQGRGVKKDLKQARAVLEKACGAGQDDACHNLRLFER